MDIEIFTLCDHAQDFGGKLVIVGTFDNIWAGGFPCVHPACSITGRLRFDPHESGRHRIRINIVDEDGREIVPPLMGELDLRPPAGVGSVAANFVLTIGQLAFPKPGHYSIDLFLDDAHARSLPLSVHLRPMEAVGPGPAGQAPPPPSG